jgi:hypothetical protein
MSVHESIRRQFGLPLTGVDSLTASKGEGVYRAGRVQWVSGGRLGNTGSSGDGVDGGGDVTDGADGGNWDLTAAVTGSHGESYRTTVALRRNGASLKATSDCTCPIASDCKHGAAALLAWLQDRDQAGPAPTSTDAPEPAAQQRSRGLLRRQHALHWARELNTVRVAGGQRPSGRAELCYVLVLQDRVARLSVFRIRPQKNGAPGRLERYLSMGDAALNPPPFWDDVDAAVALSMLQEERSATLGQALSGPRAGDVLLALTQAGRLYADTPPDPDAPALTLGAPQTAQLAWSVPGQRDADEEGDGPPLRLGLQTAAPVVPIYCTPPCYLDRSTGALGSLVLDEPMSTQMMQWLRDAPAVPAKAAPEVAIALHAVYVSRPALVGRIPEIPEQQVREVRIPPRFVLGLFSTGSVVPRNRQRPAAGSRAFMAVSLAVEYAGQRTEPLRLTTMGVQTGDGPMLVLCDRAAERKALATLREAVNAVARGERGLSIAPEPPASGASSSSSGWLTVAALPADGVAAARIKHELAGNLQALGWIIEDHSELPTSLLDAREIVADLQPEVASEPGSDRHRPGGSPERGQRDWFRLQSGIQVGDRRVDLAPLLATIVARGGFDAWSRDACPQGVLWMKVSEGEVLRLEVARIEPLARVVADWAQLREMESGEPELVIGRFAAAQLAGSLGATSLPEPVLRLRALLEGFKGLEPVEAPSSFLATLRPYQRDGLAWLQFLARGQLGGILADDMGLGKTVQLLAHIELERSTGRLDGPVLVVAPTSVIFNWEAEAARHAPGLRVLTLTGADRGRHFGELGEQHLVLTSYALLPRDAVVLRAQHWHAVVLDEAQMIKNPRTHGAAAVRSLTASHRIALTGTPLENHIGELWSIMQFVLPGLLGSEEAFRSRFRTPIEKHPGSETAAERLRALEARIRPFMLRRTKQAVLADLPLRTEIVQRIELPTEQRDLYESIRAAMDKRVREALASAGLGRSQIVLLDALLKLRQACCDPALVKLPGARTVRRSAKRDALIELLATLVDEGRKALVFSQFTSMLDLIEIAIDADPRLARVARARLDGTTADRGGAVERFQEGDAQLFLLSLKAGGVGLNLTAADTVIHYDPWWNPAVENQATDRAHRIGQQKPVFVHKLIAAGTVEERILALQARKAELAAAVLSGSLSSGGTALSQEDLLGLFAPL